MNYTITKPITKVSRSTSPRTTNSSSTTFTNTPSKPVYTHSDQVPGCATFLESLSKNMNGKKRHPAAEEYWQDYRTKRVLLAWDIFEQFNESVSLSCFKLDPKNIKLYFSDQLWNDYGFHAGYSYKGNPRTKFSKIYLSIRCLDNPEYLRNTLLHELCHASVWQIDDVDIGDHGPDWQWWVRRVAYKHPNISKLEVTSNYKCKKHLYECMNCGSDTGGKKLFPFIRRTCKECGYRWQKVIELKDPGLDYIV